MALSRLNPYRRVIRPVIDASFPKYVEQELDKIGVVTSDIVAQLKALQEQVDALSGAP
jgi:hypothetical protein